MSLLKKIRQIRLCLPTLPRGGCVYLLAASPRRSHCRVWLSFSFLLSSKEMLSLSRRGQFELLTSLLISICEREETLSHSSSSWRAYYWHFTWIHPNWRIGDHSPLVSEWRECSTNLAQRGRSMMKRGLSLFLSQVWGDIKKRGKPVSEAWMRQDGSPACREIKAVEVEAEGRWARKTLRFDTKRCVGLE